MTQLQELPARQATVRQQRREQQAAAVPATGTFDLAGIDAVVKDCSLATLEGQGQFERALKLAHGMNRLREMITDQMMAQSIMPLMNTKLGFRTDRDPKVK